MANKNRKMVDEGEFWKSINQSTQDPNQLDIQVTPEPVEPVVPIEPVVEEPAVTQEPAEPIEPNEPVEPVVAEPDQPDEPTVEPAIIDDWDEPATPEPTDVNLYEQLGKELGVENLTKEKLQEALNPKEEVITGIPDDVALIVNLAKSGIDYKEYLSLKSANYDSFDNKLLVEQSVLDAFRDSEGNISSEAKEKMTEYLEGLSDIDYLVQGNQIRNQLKSAQAVRINQIESQFKSVSQNREAELKSSLDNFDEVSGFKVQPHQKQKLFRDVSSGDAVADMIYKSDGTYDYNKIIKAKFILDNLDKMLNYHKQRARTDEKREMINRTANVNTGVTGTPPAPEIPAEKDGLDKLIEWAQGVNRY
jgi:hypothetical protein